MEYMHYSASYDVDMAKEYGIEAAVLFNKLVYLSRYSKREDGYCWRTASELESELGLSKFQQSRAEKILVNAGLIETKVTYIAGTLNRCKHYKLIGDFSLSESKETLLSIESKETSLSEDKETSLSIDNNHTSNNLNNHIYMSPKVQKHRYGEFKHVLLSDAEYTRLTEEYGKDITERYIKTVDEYCEMKGKSYQNYNLAIRNFMKRDGVTPKKKKNPNVDPYTGGRLDF